MSKILTIDPKVNDKDDFFYSGESIKEIGAHYNMVFGERSNGKTTFGLEEILKDWIENGKQGAYIRRYDEEIKGAKGDKVWSSIAHERNLVEEWTDGEYHTIEYYNRSWYLAKYDAELNRYVKQRDPFCHAFAINQAEHYKGTSYPLIDTIVFDEFITRKYYLIDEFVEFTNLLSTIIRQRQGVKVYMFGNTVNQYCPYFDEMGLTNVSKMTQGTINVYRYGESELKVAVEYAASTKESGGKKSDVYFAFDNPKLDMITSGSWELPMYPHAPFKIKDSSIIEYFFIDFRGTLLQGDIVHQDDSLFIYIHKKTTPLKDDVKQLYSMKFSPKFNHGISLMDRPRNKIASKIAELFRLDLVFYQNNQIGELVRNYIMETGSVNSTNI